ncbi:MULTISPECIES: LacI family DNA-binding transcriptional regulator [Sinorhizobium]|uniref:LacI family transcriptional regulator n=1 Tax=Sinorhizobium americanum TaxID=194963 RepID=A0A2S3YVK0_9HYPH|nr:MULTISPECIES: LacI family DNA-binding transcriptional regulator [Sinorhizobium]PDT39730.1 LacI family transcriptional regulator [Sinorhizobium sp. FG01]POH35653.1 LacI family transcriptional regulator [Sinorhizobium americanum]
MNLRGKVITLHDVAVRAGVSRMTVSKVLRGAGNISAETRRRVKQAADELGYLPNHLAGTLSSRKSRMVAVIIPSISDIVFSEVLSGINAALRPEGFQTFIGESLFDPQTETELIRAMLSFRPAGLLLNGGMARSAEAEKLLARRNCPAIQLWDCDAGALDFSAGPSHEEAGLLVAKHFLERGLRRIAYVGAELDKDLCARRRYLSLKSALAAAGIDLLRVTCDDRPRQAVTGRFLTEELMRAHPDVDAIHFLNDAMALGGLSYLHQAGISVPDRISVVGFNGTSLANAVRTRLTTIDMARTEIGEKAAQALLQMIAAKEVPGAWQATLKVVQGNTTVAA